MPLPERATCGDCGVLEGQLHEDGCDMERCAFCGHQRISCGCAEKHFYPKYERDLEFPQDFRTMTKAACAEFVGLPLDVYMNGLSDEQQAEWDRIEAAKGFVPFILYPNICRRCGALWPDMFKVPDAEWEKHVEIAERDEMLCRGCYDQIKGYIEDAKLDRENLSILRQKDA